MSKVVNLISEYTSIFDSFSMAYIFGSTLINNEFSNDIDLLLVYRKYSKETLNEINNVTSFLNELIQLPIDITALSESELEQTKFLEKLGSKYVRIK